VLDILEGLLGHPLPRDHTDPRVGDIRDSQADQSRVRALFASVEPVDFSTGLAETLAWFRASQAVA
jgi:UDP-glucose 4-epimerase